MSNSTRLEKLEIAQEVRAAVRARVSQTPLTKGELAHFITVALYHGQLPKASPENRARAERICQIFEAAAARKAAAERQENV